MKRKTLDIVPSGKVIGTVFPRGSATIYDTYFLTGGCVWLCPMGRWSGRANCGLEADFYEKVKNGRLRFVPLNKE